MTRRRAAAVSGLFYPDNPGTLTRRVDELLRGASFSGPPPRAVIAPHAGYVYSGPVAASVYAGLGPAKKVILLGPSHRVYCRGLALSSAEVFETPLGDIAVDHASFAAAARLPGVRVMDEAHEHEHSLEVHLPFLQRRLGRFDLLPILVGETTPEEVATVIGALWQDEDTLVVISTDLSHFLDYETAAARDACTGALIESLSTSITPAQACGCRPVNGFLRVAEERRLSVRALDIRSSGDTAGGRDRVVGYGAFSVT